MISFIIIGRNEGWKLTKCFESVSDTIKQNSKEAIVQLQQMGLNVVMVSGDNKRAAKAIAKEVGNAVSQWRNVARSRGIGSAEISRMSSAFDHKDLQQAISF